MKITAPYQKHYMSRAQTRAMAMFDTVGDPFGGPAYGERRDPVSAVIAVASIAAGAAGAAELVAGTVTLASVADGLLVAGGAMNLAGQATGNTDLQKLGSVAELAGGVGNLADSSSFFQDTLKDTSSSVSQSALDTANASGDQIQSLNESQGWTPSSQTVNPNAGPTTAEQITQQAQSTDTTLPSNANTPAAAPETPGANLSTGTPPPPSVTDATTAQILNNGAAAPATDTSQGLINSAMTPAVDSSLPNPDTLNSSSPNYSLTDSTASGEPGIKTGTSTGPKLPTTVGDKSLMDSLKGMSTMDKLLAAKIGADVVGGAMSYVAPTPQQQAQTGYYNAAANNANASAAANNANAAKTQADLALQQQRIANLNRNMQLGLGITANPDAVKVTGPELRTGGLINSARAA